MYLFLTQICYETAHGVVYGCSVRSRARCKTSKLNQCCVRMTARVSVVIVVWRALLCRIKTNVCYTIACQYTSRQHSLRSIVIDTVGLYAALKSRPIILVNILILLLPFLNGLDSHDIIRFNGSVIMVIINNKCPK